MNINTLRSVAFKLMWEVINSNIFTDFSYALTTAWLLAKLQDNRETVIYFYKVDKDTKQLVQRRAVANKLIVSNLDKGYVRFMEVLPNGDEQIRSFRFERLIFDKQIKQQMDADYNIAISA